MLLLSSAEMISFPDGDVIHPRVEAETKPADMIMK